MCMMGGSLECPCAYVEANRMNSVLSQLYMGLGIELKSPGFHSLRHPASPPLTVFETESLTKLELHSLTSLADPGILFSVLEL